MLLSTVLLIQNIQSVPLSSQSLIKAPTKASGPTASAGLLNASSFNESTTTFNESTRPMQFANWTRSMFHIHAPRAGCFKATYPSTVWQPNQCGTAPLLPLLPSLPSTMGNGNDEVAQAPSSKFISSSVGSFQVSGLTSETDVCVAPFFSSCGHGQGAHAFGLQVNSQTFTTSTTYTGGKSTTGWEQFVFVTDPSGQYFTGVFIQYWLLGYGSSCPSTGPPGGSSWMSYSGDCYANSLGAITPLEAPTNLSSLSLGGYANFGNSGYDEVKLCISGGNCYSVSITDQVLNLYKNWKDAEFNVFGYGGGSQAQFNSGTSINVSNTLSDPNGNVIVPSCVNTGYTGETNNLNLGSCFSYSNGQIVFTESNGATTNKQTLTTGVSSGSGSVSPNCPSGCSEAVGSSVTVTATPSSGWQFSTWSTQTGISCSANPCKFSMPNNAVTLKATFIPKLVTLTVSYAIVGGGTPSAPNFNYVAGGIPESLALTTTPVGVAADFGSSWSVTPNPLSGSGAGERWFTTQATSGTIAGSSTLAFKYQHQFYLTMQVIPSGAGSTTPSSSGWYNAGQKVTIGAAAKTGYKFLSWTGSGAGSYAGTSSSATITMNAQITETATLGVIITVTSNPTGSGYVVVDSVAVKTPQTFTWVIGSTHTIAAASPVSCGAGCQYVFTAWSGGGTQSHIVTVPSSPTTYTATFQKQYLLTLSVSPSGFGLVPSSGWYNAGQKFTITATAGSGHTFKSWKGTGSGSYSGTSSSPTITTNSAITETANFT